MYQQSNNGMTNGFNPFDIFRKLNEFGNPRQMVQYLLTSGRISQQMLNEFQQSITGNPRQIVQNMLNSGKMSQSQFNWLAQMANEFQKHVR